MIIEYKFNFIYISVIQFSLGTLISMLYMLEMCKAIWTALSEYVKPPSNEEDWIAISKEFSQRWNFPNCIGKVMVLVLYIFLYFWFFYLFLTLFKVLLMGNI